MRVRRFDFYVVFALAYRSAAMPVLAARLIMSSVWVCDESPSGEVNDDLGALLGQGLFLTTRASVDMRASFHIVDLSSGKSRCFRVLAAIACRMQNLSEQFLSFAQQSQFESARKL